MVKTMHFFLYKHTWLILWRFWPHKLLGASLFFISLVLSSGSTCCPDKVLACCPQPHELLPGLNWSFLEGKCQQRIDVGRINYNKILTQKKPHNH